MIVPLLYRRRKVMQMRNKFKVEGEITRIYLQVKDGKKLATLIDTIDLPKAQEMGGTWYALWFDSTQTYYVRGNTLPDENKKRKIVSLHRWLMGEDKRQVDHISHDTLDNRRSCNLRWASASENQQNRERSMGRSGVRGVVWNEQRKKWRSLLTVNRKRIDVGHFDNVKDAEIALKEARKIHMPYSREALQ